jgi:hypothetical protein
MIGSKFTVFDPGQTITGRRWGGEDLVTGAYVDHWGTGATAILVELDDGERVSIVAETARAVERTGRHRAPEKQVALPRTAEVPTDLLPLPSARDDQPTEFIPAVGQDVAAAGEPTEVFPVVDEIGPEYAAGLADAIVHGIDGEGADPAWVLEQLRPTLRERLLTPWFWLVSFVHWLVDEVATTIRLSARWELEHSQAIARTALATVSFLILAGAGVVWLLVEVAR